MRLRQAILYAAFSAEAYINGYISLACPDQAQSLDSAATLERILLATRLTAYRNVFDKGAEPIQGLAALFRRRNKLVHHRPGPVQRVFDRKRGLVPYDQPQEVVKYILAVANATSTLDECLDDIGVANPLEEAWDLGDEIDISHREIEAWFVGEPVLVALEEAEYLRRLAKTLDGGPPAEGSTPPRTLLRS